MKPLIKRILIALCATVLVIALCVGGLALYARGGYKAEADAVAAFAELYGVTVTELDGGVTAYGDADSSAALIFYPGGRVEHTAYEPLMRCIAQREILCILIQMPFELAVLDINAADGLRELYPEVGSWYIGGHSLGGAMAASYASSHTDSLEGLILLGAYSTADISNSSLRVLSVYGSEDGVMDREKYEKYRENLPDGLCESVIEGGCHAYFGTYGVQKGDGTPTLSAREQIDLSAEHITSFILTEDQECQK